MPVLCAHFRIEQHRSFSHPNEMDVEGPFMLAPSAETIMANNFWVASNVLGNMLALSKGGGTGWLNQENRLHFCCTYEESMVK